MRARIAELLAAKTGPQEKPKPKPRPTGKLLSLESRVSIAFGHAHQRYRVLFDQYVDDLRQEAWVCVLGETRGHDSVQEIRRVAGRHLTPVARKYGYGRVYLPGPERVRANLGPIEKQLSESGIR